MKQIVYQKQRKREVVEHDVYHDHEYYILNLGTHPTAYVEDKLDVIGYSDERLDDVRVHGGFTYGKYNNRKMENGNGKITKYYRT